MPPIDDCGTNRAEISEEEELSNFEICLRRSVFELALRRSIFELALRRLGNGILLLIVRILEVVDSFEVADLGEGVKSLRFVRELVRGVIGVIDRGRGMRLRRRGSLWNLKASVSYKSWRVEERLTPGLRGLRWRACLSLGQLRWVDSFY